ncbi:hypothetical protein [Micromonospora tarensis]|uniref:Uncharacterized protein n=1 Tax=Micromonospora tarensis TaxID=2806100 RepID=A0ABS1YIV1_9ACTN|nr:hypothetical protein [Micromonospora tarensis]MBM0277228.1 hypothetical protein [Micromonospora tarensis]
MTDHSSVDRIGQCRINKDRRLLAEVSRWRKANDWRDSSRGFQNAPFEDGATVAVRPNEAGFQVWRKPADAPHFTGQPTEYPAESVREAIDMLVALRILPPQFSSAYEAGRSDAAFIANVETRPDRRCRYCGATSGLILVPGNPLTGAGRGHECVDGCKGGQMESTPRHRLTAELRQLADDVEAQRIHFGSYPTLSLGVLASRAELEQMAAYFGSEIQMHDDQIPWTTSTIRLSHSPYGPELQVRAQIQPEDGTR